MPLRIGLIGVGTMGRNHARVLESLDEVEFVAAADPDPIARTFVERRTHAKWYASSAELLSRTLVDAVVIAAPTRAHHDLACEALARGIHVLVEKPLAMTAHEARELIALASSKGVLLLPGHIERFNPAVAELKRRLECGELGRIFQVQARRQSPYPARLVGLGVTIDLATHDIDLMRHVLHSEPTTFYARTARSLHAAHEDLLTAVLTFPDGAIATIQVNWLTPTKIREVQVLGERGMFLVHTLSQDLTFYANQTQYSADDWTELATLVGVTEGDVTRFAIVREEPLLLELRNFVSACQGLAQPLVTAEDGLHTLEIAERLLSEPS